MIKLNRTTEYGLVALRHISRKQALKPNDPQSVTSAREISDYYGLPFEITAKTLQRLKDTGLIVSAQGAKGGYTLRRPLSEVSLAEFLQLMEGPRSVVACASSHLSSSETTGKVVVSPGPAPGAQGGCSCEYHQRCEIRGLMANLNSKILDFLSGIRLAELADMPVSVGHREGEQK